MSSIFQLLSFLVSFTFILAQDCMLWNATVNQCIDKDWLPLVIEEIQLDNDENGILLSGVFKLKEPFEQLLYKVSMVGEICYQHDGSCKQFKGFDSDSLDLCEIIEEDSSEIIESFFQKIDVPRKCPIPAGEYVFKNLRVPVCVDISATANILAVLIRDDNEELGCFTVNSETYEGP